ncbi:hypothetical protein DFH07DRAFT_775344 [Mycena maculata]|uniref:Uncharacterized protein n=1 Tax=Mycena maculata TaxID=230809 RepID=A0AAD7IVZ3_9AGAR|nr:hypothetical protein DFH07DRAFT_775344 [Mycena maculata]
MGPGPTGDQLAAEAGSSLHGQGQNPVRGRQQEEQLCNDGGGYQAEDGIRGNGDTESYWGVRLEEILRVSSDSPGLEGVENEMWGGRKRLELLPATHWVTKGHIEHRRRRSQLVACFDTGIQNGWTGWKKERDGRREGRGTTQSNLHVIY